MALYAVDAKHLWHSTPSTRSISYAVDEATRRVDKNRAQFEGMAQRWPSTGNEGRSATPAAASPPMLRRVTAAWGVRMLLQARKSSATSRRCRIIVRV